MHASDCQGGWKAGGLLFEISKNDSVKDQDQASSGRERMATLRQAGMLRSVPVGGGACPLRWRRDRGGLSVLEGARATTSERRRPQLLLRPLNASTEGGGEPTPTGAPASTREFDYNPEKGQGEVFLRSVYSYGAHGRFLFRILRHNLTKGAHPLPAIHLFRNTLQSFPSLAAGGSWLSSPSTDFPGFWRGERRTSARSAWPLEGKTRIF